jgi:hypothetical protein
VQGTQQLEIKIFYEVSSDETNNDETAFCHNDEYDGMK